MSDIVGHIVEHVADAALLDPAMRVAAGIAADRIEELVGPERLRNLKETVRRTVQKLNGKKLDPPPLSVSLPLLEAARDENREELLELWASLLAAACDPTKRKFYRREFVDIAKRLEPLDVAVLPMLNDTAQMMPTRRAVIASRLGVSEDEVSLSFRNLQRLDLVSQDNPGSAGSAQPWIQPLGRQFLRAVAP
jgi:hypothetical protein